MAIVTEPSASKRAQQAVNEIAAAYPALRVRFVDQYTPFTLNAPTTANVPGDGLRLPTTAHYVTFPKLWAGSRKHWMPCLRESPLLILPRKRGLASRRPSLKNTWPGPCGPPCANTKGSGRN